MGLVGQARHPDVWQKLKEGLHRCKRAGKPAGILTGTDADSVRCIKDGFTFVAVGSDAALLTRGPDDLLVRIRRAITD